MKHIKYKILILFFIAFNLYSQSQTIFFEPYVGSTQSCNDYKDNFTGYWKPSHGSPNSTNGDEVRLKAKDEGFDAKSEGVFIDLNHIGINFQQNNNYRITYYYQKISNATNSELTFRSYLANNMSESSSSNCEEEPIPSVSGKKSIYTANDYLQTTYSGQVETVEVEFTVTQNYQYLWIYSDLISSFGDNSINYLDITRVLIEDLGGNDPDSDGDGVPDSQDDCPNEYGPASNNGCPIVDCSLISPNNILFTEVSNNSVKIDWNNISNNNGYKLEYKQINSNSPNFIEMDESVTELILNNLQQNTEYEVRIKTKCSSNSYGEWSDYLIFITLNQSCNLLYPDGRESRFIEGNSANLTWNKYSVDYGVQYKKHSSTAWKEVRYINMENARLVNLTASTEYDWRVRSECSNGAYGSWSPIEHFHTKLRCDRHVGNISVSQITNHSARLEWSSLGSEVSYKVEYTSSDLTTINVITTTNYIDLDNLRSSSEYSIGIIAIYRNDSDDHIRRIHFTTLDGNCSIQKPYNFRGLTSNSIAKLHWNNVPNNYGYIIYIENISIYHYGVSKRIKTSPNSTELILPDLEPGCWYSATITTICNDESVSHRSFTHFISPPKCRENIIINYDNPSSIIYIAENSIRSNSHIGQGAKFNAGEIIILENGFHVKATDSSANFRAFIEGCTSSSRSSKKSKANTSGEVVNSIEEEVYNYIKLYPNPTKDFITVESTKDVSSWIMTDAYGKSYFSGTNTKETINTTNLPKGIYFLKTILTNGKVVMKKVVKN